MIDLDKLREIANNATQGQWESHDTYYVGVYESGDEVAGVTSRVDVNYLVAAQPKVVLELLDMIDEIIDVVNWQSA